MSFFRYPGGKSKLKNQIINKLQIFAEKENLEYREPFFGGGGIGCNFIEKNNYTTDVWINDFDLGVSCLWTTVINRPDLLKNRVRKFTPTPEAFYDFKEQLLNPPVKITSDIEYADFGFKKLAIHQISYSGLGTKSGGPLGGKSQSSAYTVGVRWSPEYICKKIDYYNGLFKKYHIRENYCSSKDFLSLVEDNSKPALLYLDPPYYIKGSQVYQHFFSENDHKRLAGSLKNTSHMWILSYDDCDQIRDLYSWADIESVSDVNYTINQRKDKATGKRTVCLKPELLIFKKEAFHDIEKTNQIAQDD